MADIDIKKLAMQLDAAQAILDQIRVNSGCKALGTGHSALPVRIVRALATAQRAYDDRKNRSNFIGGDEIFGEPAWDILLDLFIRQTLEEEVSVKSACLNSKMLPSTTMRWLRVLEGNNLVSFMEDPNDAAQSFLHLTAEGYEGMLRYLDWMAR
jgi:DNA-binding MarR family transcriptional regulator